MLYFPLPSLPRHPHVDNFIAVAIHNIEPRETRAAQARVVGDNTELVSNGQLSNLLGVLVSTQDAVLLADTAEDPALVSLGHDVSETRGGSCVLAHSQSARVAQRLAAVSVAAYNGGKDGECVLARSGDHAGSELLQVVEAVATSVQLQSAIQGCTRRVLAPCTEDSSVCSRCRPDRQNPVTRYAEGARKGRGVVDALDLARVELSCLVEGARLVRLAKVCKGVSTHLSRTNPRR